jgi:hypothetical protein
MGYLLHPKESTNWRSRFTVPQKFRKREMKGNITPKNSPERLSSELLPVLRLALARFRIVSCCVPHQELVFDPKSCRLDQNNHHSPDCFSGNDPQLLISD